jgi:cytoskeletal protein RodZ
MEHSPDNKSAQGEEKGRRNLFWGLALLAVLIVGVTSGYLISQAQNTLVQVVVTATPEPNQQAAGQTAAQPPTKPATTPSSTADNANTPPTPTIMEFVLSDARHFQGSDKAPITMIEFSDFK